MTPRAHRRTLSTVLAVAIAAGLVPPAAAAWAEPGVKLEQLELATVEGGRAPLLAASANAQAIVFFRTDQERSTDALKQIAGLERALAGKGVRWIGVVSGSDAPPEARRAVAASGVQMKVVVDAGDKLYQKLQLRMHPAVAVVDGKGVLQAIEPYREVDFAGVLEARLRFVLGEIDQAALDRAVNPESSPLPGTDPLKKALADVKMARMLIDLGQLDAAIKRAQRALEQAPVPAAFPVLGLAYARLGRCAEARKMLDQAKRTAPDSGDLAAARALCPAR